MHLLYTIFFKLGVDNSIHVTATFKNIWTHFEEC